MLGDVKAQKEELDARKALKEKEKKEKEKLGLTSPETNQQMNLEKMLGDVKAQKEELDARKALLEEQEKLFTDQRNKDETEMIEFYQEQLGMTAEQKEFTKDKSLKYFQDLRELQKLQFNIGEKGVPKNPTQPIAPSEKKKQTKGYLDPYTGKWV